MNNNDRLPLELLKNASLPYPDSGETPRPKAQERFSEEEMAKIMAGFAKRLKTVFNHANNSEIARRLKTTDATVKLYVDGKRLPVAEMLLQIQMVTGANIHWLLTGQGERQVNRGNQFSEDEERRIREMAEARKIGFDEMVRRLAMAAAELVDKI